jgi:phosphoglycolate phosphatase
MTTVRLTFDGLADEHVETLIEETAVEDNETIARMGGTIYPGVEAGLKRLAEHFPLFIVSNCQEGYIENFLAYSGYGSLFQDFECFGNTGRPKAENLRWVIERNGLRSPVMIGDADGDELAARACGVPFIFASYGFGGCLSPDYVVGSFDQITELLLAHRKPSGDR